MVTAAQRAEAAAAAKATASPSSPPPTADDDGTPREVVDDLDGMTLTELRTEAKRLAGADYDHSMDQDRAALIDLARGLRLERAAYYAQQRKAQREAALSAMRDD